MAVPGFEEMKLPILKHLAGIDESASVSADDMRSFIVDHFSLSEQLESYRGPRADATRSPTRGAASSNRTAST